MNEGTCRSFRILHIVSSVGSGGVERMLLNYYEELVRQGAPVAFDLVVHDHQFRMLESKFLAIGAKVFFVTPKKRSGWRNLMEVWRIVREGQYDAVHCHQNSGNWFGLGIAFLNQVPVRISHAHGVTDANHFWSACRFWLERHASRLLATDFVSCSEVAGRWLHGVDALPLNELPSDGTRSHTILRNSIAVEDFCFCNVARQDLRRQFQMEDRFVLLQVGRFSIEKNQFFSLDVIEALDDRYVLLFVGAGPLEEAVRKAVRERRLENRVFFLGERSDVAQVMAMADVLLLPSISEGFGICAIEGQATGLPVLASEAVPNEVKVTGYVQFLSLDVDVWRRQVELEGDSPKKDIERIAANVVLANSPFQIDVAVKQYLTWLNRL